MGAPVASAAVKETTSVGILVYLHDGDATVAFDSGPGGAGIEPYMALIVVVI